MDGVSSIRVSGGFQLSSLKRVISVPVDKLKLDFIQAYTEAQQDLERDLSRFYGVVEWSTSTADDLCVRCTDPNRDILNWQRDVEECVKQYAGRLLVKKTAVSTLDYSQITRKLTIPQKILIRSDMDTQLVYVIGMSEDVENATLKIEEWDNKDLPIKMQKEIPLTKCELFLLRSGIESEIKRRVPNITVSIDSSRNSLLLFGDEESLQSASLVVSNERFYKERLITEISPERRFLLTLENTKQYFCRKLTNSRVLCYVDTTGEYVKLCAFTENDLNKAETLLDTTIKEKYVDVQGDFEGSISPSEYTPMFRQIESKFPGQAKVEFVPIQCAVRIVTVVDHLQTILKEVESILSRSQVFEIVDVYRPCILRHFFKVKADEIKALSKLHNVQVLANTTLSALKVSGKYEAIANFREGVEKLIQSIQCRKLVLPLPLECKERFPDMCLTLEAKVKCAVDVLNMCHFGTEEIPDRKVIVMNGFLKCVECDVLVVYSNPRLRHTSKQSKSIIQAGGKILTKEFKAHFEESEEGREWHVVTTGPGNLGNCLAVYHIIAPESNSQVSVDSLKHAYQLCFSLMEKQKFRSFAFSCNEELPKGCQSQAFSGFLKEYFDVHNDSGIRTVVFCDEEQSANYFLYELLASKINWSCELTSQLHNNITSCSIRPGLDWDKTPVIQTALSFSFDIGSIKIHVLLGDLTDLKVDAIVNGSNKLLDLSKGAVSQNILIKGGVSLDEQLRSKEIRRGIAKNGITVTTSGENSQIPCLYIFHVDAASVSRARNVTGAWKKMVGKCLKKAEELRLSSLAFPALGTGSLHGDLKSTTQFMLEAMEEFLKRRPVHLSHVYIVVLEHPVLEELHDAMRDRYIAKQRLWNPEYSQEVNGEILICGDSHEVLEEAAQCIKRDVYGINTNT